MVNFTFFSPCYTTRGEPFEMIKPSGKKHALCWRIASKFVTKLAVFFIFVNIKKVFRRKFRHFWWQGCVPYTSIWFTSQVCFLSTLFASVYAPNHARFHCAHNYKQQFEWLYNGLKLIKELMNLYLHFDHEVRGKPVLNCSERQESSSLRLRELDEFESFLFFSIREKNERKESKTSLTIVVNINLLYL